MLCSVTVATYIIAVCARLVAVTGAEACVVLMVTDDASSARDVALLDVDAQRCAAEVGYEFVAQCVGRIKAVRHIVGKSDRPSVGAGFSSTFRKAAEVESHAVEVACNCALRCRGG